VVVQLSSMSVDCCRAGALWLAMLVVSPSVGASAAAPAAALLGKPAPELVGRPIAGGGNVRLSEHQGEVVMLTFWTSWSGESRALLPRLDKLGATYAPAGLVTIGVSLDDHPDAAAEVVRTLGLRFANTLDAQKALGRRFDVATVPLVLLIDRAGVVRFLHAPPEAVADATLVAELRRLLDE
jgi:thiol-disulfide isomerase/thioredoxin